MIAKFGGKSIFIWNIFATCGGDVGKITSALVAGGFEGAYLHSPKLATWNTPERIALVQSLKQAGIQVWGSAAVYGGNPIWEGQTAATITMEQGLEGFAFDAEGMFDAQPKADTNASKLLQAYRAGAPGLGWDRVAPAGWCWWPLHHSKTGKKIYHPKGVLWAAMQKNYGDADFGLPMAYWNWGDSGRAAVEFLNESVKQWQEITDKPLVPIGRAYIGDHGTPNAVALQAFEERARALGAAAVSWWAMEHALDAVHLPEIWPALANLGKFGLGKEPVQTWAQALDSWARSKGFAGPAVPA